MAEELDPIKQRIDIEVNDKGVDSAASSVDELTTSINESTTATKKQDNAFKSLKAQLKDATVIQQKLAQQYGATSQEAINAAKNVARIKDEIGFQKDLVDSYNPDEKFRGLTQTAGLAALALGGVKDGLNAVGIESKALDQVIGTAQAILGVTSAVGGLTDAYQVLTATQKAKSAAEVVSIGTTEALAVAEGEATAATWSWNAALLANPIVLITAGIVAAGAAIYAYVKITGDAAKEEERLKVASMQLTQAIQHQNETFERNNKELSDNNNQKIALLRASGASEAQIYKETQALKAQEIQLAQNYRNELQRIEQRAYELNRINSTDATREALKVAQENLKAANDAILKNFDEVDKIRNDHNVAVVQAETEARRKREEEAKREREKEIEDRKKAKEKAIQDAKDLAKSVAQAKLDTEKEIAEADAERQKNREEVEKEDIERQVKTMQDFADREAEIDEARAQQKQENQDRLVSQGDQLIKNIQNLAGKNKAIQRAAIIAEGGASAGKAVANTSEAVTKDLAKGFPFSAPLVALDVAVGATSVASIIKGTSDALKAVGGGGASIGNSGGGGSTIPGRNVAQVGFQASPENQISTAIAQQQRNQPPIEAFVVSQAMTNKQELDRKKELQNSF